jgi:hypothetical protein
VRVSPTLLRYAEDLPQELRAEYFGALLEVFRVYVNLDEEQREEMLEQFKVSLEEEFARKRWDH